MLYLERTINVNKGQALIDEKVILYKGDKNVEIRFNIMNNPFKNKSGGDINKGKLLIKNETSGDYFTVGLAEITNPSRLVFVLDGDKIDEDVEKGKYTFQIRLLGDESRATLPEIKDGIEIKQPICDDEEAAADVAVIDEAYISEGNEDEAFDAEGNYNATEWSSGMVISSGKLNKIENAIGTINETNQSIQSDMDNVATVDYVLNNYLTKSSANDMFVSKHDLGDIDAILDFINGEVI